MEIDYNKSNLEAESQQHHKQRLLLEVCNIEDMVVPGKGCKCLVRLEFRKAQKKTKKNLNCSNPKFYELFRYPLGSQQNFEDESVIIQVITIASKDLWHVIA